jgi:hypothetical protein
MHVTCEASHALLHAHLSLTQRTADVSDAFLCQCHVQECAKRIESSDHEGAHCTGWAFDYWRCIDKCVSVDWVGDSTDVPVTCLTAYSRGWSFACVPTTAWQQLQQEQKQMRHAVVNPKQRVGPGIAVAESIPMSSPFSSGSTSMFLSSVSRTCQHIAGSCGNGRLCAHPVCFVISAGCPQALCSVEVGTMQQHSSISRQDGASGGRKQLGACAAAG